jgi:antitoxin ParD1/3/4
MPISADLGEKLEAVVTDLVANGRYNSKSEVLREGVRLVQEREAALAKFNADLDRSLEQAERGELQDADEVFSDFRRRIDALRKSSAA